MHTDRNLGYFVHSCNGIFIEVKLKNFDVYTDSKKKRNSVLHLCDLAGY